MAAGTLIGKGGRKLLKWGTDIIGDAFDTPETLRGVKAKAPKKTTAKTSKKTKAKTSKKTTAKASEKTKAKTSKRGRKSIRGRPTAAVQKVMDEEGVTRREAEKIVRERKKKVGEKTIKKQSFTAAQQRYWDSLSPEQQKRISAWDKMSPTRREKATTKRTRSRFIKGAHVVSPRWRKKLEQQTKLLDPNYNPPRKTSNIIPTGVDRLSGFGLDPSVTPRKLLVEGLGPVKSKVLLPKNLSTAQRRRFAKTGQGIPVAKTRKNPRGMVDTGLYAPPRKQVAEQMRPGGVNESIEDIMKMVKAGKLTVQKSGGQIKTRTKPRGVGKATHGWGSVSKGRK
jgi:K+-transporting ATPase c subunit